MRRVFRRNKSVQRISGPHDLSSAASPLRVPSAGLEVNQELQEDISKPMHMSVTVRHKIMSRMEVTDVEGVASQREAGAVWRVSGLG